MTWRAGPPHRYDVALRPRGRTRVAHAGRAYGADVWPGATRTPVRGATWRGGLVSGTRGPWLVFWGGNALGVNRPLIYRGKILFFLPCGTMFPHGFFFRVGLCSHTGDVDARRASNLLTDGYDRVDPSPRDHQSNTCANPGLSEAADG